LDKVDITIIGAGVIGLAIAENLSNKNTSCIILEKNSKFGQETSSRNSEVIHSGIYYQNNSLKAKLCVEGNRLLYQYCKKHSIPHLNLGKILVATNEDEIEDLENLKKNAANNGVENLKLLSKREIRTLEPDVQATDGLLSPSTGIIDTHKLMQSLLCRAQDQGTIISYDSEVSSIERLKEGFRLTVKKDNYRFDTNILINAAGLNSDVMASLTGIDIDKHKYILNYCKGHYFRTRQKFNIKKLIYPVPTQHIHSLGIHLTLDLAGGLRFGPDAHYLKKIDYSMDDRHRNDFHTAIKKYLPQIELESLYADTCGIRPKLQGADDGFKDFVINNEETKGFPGLINLIGIESPGLTSSLAIAKYVQEML
jgi:L-2-hydroxyglutarate oxidase LhgO